MNQNLCYQSSHCHLWRVIASSVCGTSHEKAGLPCQDDNYWKVIPEGILAAAVADSAGSASLGNVGAAIAVRSAVEALCLKAPELRLAMDDSYWQGLLADAVKAAKLAVESEASALNVKSRELATTLIVFIATGSLIVAAQVGDGAVVLEDGNGNIFAHTTPGVGEFINETSFLISPDVLNTIQTCIWHGDLKHIAILSDGLQMIALKMPDGIPYAPFFSYLFRFADKMADEAEAKEQLTSFLRSPRVTERTDDDVTLLLATIVD